MKDPEDTVFTPTVTHWGNFRIEHRGNDIRGVHPYADDPEPSPIGENLRAALDPAVRVSQPMVRQSYLTTRRICAGLIAMFQCRGIGPSISRPMRCAGSAPTMAMSRFTAAPTAGRARAGSILRKAKFTAS